MPTSEAAHTHTLMVSQDQKKTSRDNTNRGEEKLKGIIKEGELGNEERRERERRTSFEHALLFKYPMDLKEEEGRRGHARQRYNMEEGELSHNGGGANTRGAGLGRLKPTASSSSRDVKISC